MKHVTRLAAAAATATCDWFQCGSSSPIGDMLAPNCTTQYVVVRYK